MGARPNPKRRVSEQLPRDLVEFLSGVAELIAAGAEETRIPSDDLLQCKCAYGGLCEEGGGVYGFTYFPATPVRPSRSRVRWEVQLSQTQLRLVADGSLASLPLWACTSPECGCRFSSAEDRCFDCDYPARLVLRLPEGPFGDRREWALAFFDLNPTATSFEMIGAFNGMTDWGETLGSFSFEDAEAAHREHGARSRA